MDLHQLIEHISVGLDSLDISIPGSQITLTGDELLELTTGVVMDGLPVGVVNGLLVVGVLQGGTTGQSTEGVCKLNVLLVDLSLPALVSIPYFLKIV